MQNTMNILITILGVLALSGCSTISVLDKEPELHSIGVYEGMDPDDDGIPWHAKCGDRNPLLCHRLMTQRKREIGGQVVVNVSIIGKPLVLGFSAYDKTKWIVKTQKGVLIEKVILGGYHSQTIEGIPLETPIEVYTYDSSSCARCYKGNIHFYSYKGVPKQLENITGLSASSWQGKYQGKEFSIFPGMRNLEQTK
jgi:hypothetical protein